MLSNHNATYLNLNNKTLLVWGVNLSGTIREQNNGQKPYAPSFATRVRDLDGMNEPTIPKTHLEALSD